MSITVNAMPLRLERRSQDESLWVIPIEFSPFIIGRSEGSNLLLTAEEVSRKHAEILETGDGWRIKDCGSTNGTFVNGRRLTDNYLLNHGDYITIGGIRFDVVEQIDDAECTQFVSPDAENLERMLDLKAVVPHFQPLISLKDGSLTGYEILGRIAYDGLPKSPAQLFEISRRLGRQIELSELFRDTALEHAAQLGIKELILFNTLPEEMNLECLGRSLKKLRESVPGLKLGLELHENTITNVEMMKNLRSMLHDLDMLLVYDDFGAGQSRLVELLDSVPDIVKFDIALIQNIQKRSEISRSIVETLVKMARDAGIRTLAEGVDSREEAETCRSIGFELAQGFYFGRPAPLSQL
ncbi:MAG: EAL domain-containing protein [Desulfuromonadaceae bacterium]|nr:EAL domain-containing protein [Desulfuromonadaceae bacterium]